MLSVRCASQFVGDLCQMKEAQGGGKGIKGNALRRLNMVQISRKVGRIKTIKPI